MEEEGAVRYRSPSGAQIVAKYEQEREESVEIAAGRRGRRNRLESEESELNIHRVNRVLAAARYEYSICGRLVHATLNLSR